MAGSRVELRPVERLRNVVGGTRGEGQRSESALAFKTSKLVLGE
jgi:hypothetical protein